MQEERRRSGGYGHYYGDIHNHNGLGYGKGSLERSLDIAREHLDFFAFTGHASWHDMAPMEGGREAHWEKGFARLKAAWPNVQGLIAEANREGEFGAFLGFEWHSSGWGDQCVIFPGDNEPICYAKGLEELRGFCRNKGALMIPHHIVYPEGNRGMNWAAYDPECSPVVEIYSEHGNGEEDRGLYPYFNHSMGGRIYSNSAIAALERGHRFGFVGSSDTHSGFPGAYGEGLLGVLAEGIDRKSILEAIWARRTYALTGDRIAIAFKGNGAWMGSEVETGETLELSWDIRGADELDEVEIIADGRTVHRAGLMQDFRRVEEGTTQGNIRFEWGWGPWGDLALERITDWDLTIRVENGRIGTYFPCLQSGPFSEERRHRLRLRNEQELEVTSYTSRKEAYRQNPNQSLILSVEGDERTVISVEYREPCRRTFRHTLEEIKRDSHWNPMGPFPRESALWHRLVPRQALVHRGRFTYPVERASGYAYLRVRQRNGHLGWASPVYYTRGNRES
ncbi:MAG: hypothetical protein R6V45_11955 [Oceanipulchritudo sp.]